MSYDQLFITQYFMAAYQVINNKRKRFINKESTETSVRLMTP